ncbi:MULTISPECIES: threonine ammonia-lyase [Halobacillus]|uniref:L-threonine dehydratase catabolic TdcB n=1 Tax=Halobacillus halophilus (strain ATCC 35676 / DSM 2266 / JCM 20832 / KCTC 3685 / LMG 17431 / NBRC 102448 / NCIMB 2269) TaxID=866895 RepID=I0JLA3_HALH3|nr:threonine ammonia-lyase [Halobacillus halophilus]ASF41467.1 serine/threonine dehydratase [Halobacillus halophilus]CCG44923.1 threonine ammonia-lyase [Halobacillus halophilus DSM 2266]
MEAHEKLQGVVHRTPLETSSTFNQQAGQQVYLKMENQQKTGAFKVRGASYKVACLSQEEAERGVIAASAGNHAQGVAVAARKRGISARIFMPEATPRAKVEATEGYGATVVLTGESFQEAYTAALLEQKESGATFLHPFDDYDVMAGQATIAVEMLQQQPDIDTLFVPIGGGGLISGVSFAAKQLKPDIQVIGVQAAEASCVYNSFYKNGPEKLTSVATIADGIAVKEKGKLTYPCIQKYVDQVITVEEHEIAQTMLHLLEREKTLVEGAGASALAGALYHQHQFESKQAGVIVSGGNMDISKLPSIYQAARPKQAALV